MPMTIVHVTTEMIGKWLQVGRVVQVEIKAEVICSGRVVHVEIKVEMTGSCQQLPVAHANSDDIYWRASSVLAKHTGAETGAGW